MSAIEAGATAQKTDRPVRVQWYRTQLDKETLASLNAKSDLKGFAQAFGHLAVMGFTGGLALYAAANWAWWTVVLALFAHGTVSAFTINAVHELVHKCVFKTQWLNQLFVRIYGFIGWHNFEHFYNSHMRHHQYTLHQPDDLEVVLPLKVMVKQFFQSAFFNPKGMPWVIKNTLRLARGRFEGRWENTLFPPDQPEKSAPVIRWARLLLVGHGLVLVASLILAVLLNPIWLLVPVVVSATPCYGHWLFFLCNNTQHIGLQDAVPDFRLCCRTFTVNPIVQFLYWHMNYHIEHHMYAAVPCYNLGKLHRAILHELPPCPKGLIATWKEIAAIQRQQAIDPTFQYVPPLPNRQAPAPASVTSDAQPQPA